jgi:hypothetical protein
MSAELATAIKFAVAGTAVGVGVGISADLITTKLLMPIIPPGQGTSAAGRIGRLLFVGVGTTVVASTVLLAGDKVMNMLGGAAEDPLYRMFYYMVGFQSMHTTRQATASFRMLADSSFLYVENFATPAATGSKQILTPIELSKSGCGKGGCGK